MELPEKSPMGCLSTTSYDTALCIIPPFSHCDHIDRLRELYDKAYETWPPHLNLIYPFVAPEILPKAQQQIQQCLDQELCSSQHIAVELNQAGLFKQRKNSVIFLQENQGMSPSFLETLRKLALQGLGQKPSPANLHLTIGQSESETMSSGAFLLAKAQLIPTLKFRIGALAILLRERASTHNVASSMRLWGTINLASPEDVWRPSRPEYWIRSSPLPSNHAEQDGGSDNDYDAKFPSTHNYDVQAGPTYCYDSDSESWIIHRDVECENLSSKGISVASYNVLIDSEYPPERDRDTLLVRTILSDAAMADILVLQEVSDDFLSYVLGDTEIQRRYPFTSHGPPDQPDIGPLPSMRNIVILSRWSFSWKSVPFHSRHKGALVAHFNGILASDPADVVVAGVHLTCGLTNGSVAAKNNQLKRLSTFLTENYKSAAWIVAGDFNITTSACTIESALKAESITQQTALTLASLEPALNEIGLHDAYSIARLQATADAYIGDFGQLFDGEAGATFDPRNNMLAAYTSSTSDNRPQRYDRIFVCLRETLRVNCFNLFGLPEDIAKTPAIASDHYGVRTMLNIIHNVGSNTVSNREMISKMKVKHVQATAEMSDTIVLESILCNQRMIPTQDEIGARQNAFELLRHVVLDTQDGQDPAMSGISLIMAAVGSYALDVWTPDSDLDCLCVGSISSKTFFKLARQRLVKAHDRGIRLLRKVEAKTGTMLELSVNGIAADLQYCPAARIAERWSEFHDLPASDPIFNLSLLALRKLKPYRDLIYIQRTVPSLSAFRLAYRCIKLWAVQRGIYSSRFGYLSGTHITLMLSWICKRLLYDVGPVGVANIIVSFFHHYATFDWTNEILFDSFFHKSTPRYHRSSREPMVILGYHTPNSNVAHTSTNPGLQVLTKEFKAAAQILVSSNTTWEKFLRHSNTQISGPCLDEGTIFLTAHQSYVKVDIQYWGRTLTRGKSLVGWIESRCLSLVVDINRTLPDLEVRIWPARFTDSGADTDEISDYQGCYLIGLSKSVVSPGDGNAEKRLSRQSLDKVLDRFLAQLRTDERNYDPSTSWVDVSLARPTETRNLRPDDREWGDYTADMGPDSDDEEDIEEDTEGLEDKPVQRAIAQRPKPTATPLSRSKLRPASDVINRLRWDPSLDPSEYIIGYEDRFLGAKETSLTHWKTEQTDEEFIPQHRILYFKKKSGNDGKGEVVWERLTRLDKVFGSGASASAGGCDV